MERAKSFRTVSLRGGRLEFTEIPNPTEVKLVFLSEGSKGFELAQLGRYIHHAKTGEDFAGRDLKFDLELEPYVRIINEYPGVVTESSCVGHKGAFAYLSLSFSQERFYQLSEVLGIDLEEVLRQGLDHPGYISKTNVPGTNYSVDIDSRCRSEDGVAVSPAVVFRVQDRNWKGALEDLISRLSVFQEE